MTGDEPDESNSIENAILRSVRLNESDGIRSGELLSSVIESEVDAEPSEIIERVDELVADGTLYRPDDTTLKETRPGEITVPGDSDKTNESDETERIAPGTISTARGIIRTLIDHDAAYPKHIEERIARAFGRTRESRDLAERVRERFEASGEIYLSEESGKYRLANLGAAGGGASLGTRTSGAPGEEV